MVPSRRSQLVACPLFSTAYTHTAIYKNIFIFLVALTSLALPLQAQPDTAAPKEKTRTMWGTYYADFFVGRKTYCGEVFRQNQYTAAHRTIPCGTYLRVHNPYTGLEVVVRVNDRCPRQNVLDMTKLAVHTLGIKGARKVEVTFLDEETGYHLWAAQDTLAMTAEEYQAFKDRSRHRRITPYDTPAELVLRTPEKGTPPTMAKATTKSPAKSTVKASMKPVAKPPEMAEVVDTVEEEAETELDKPVPVVVQSQPAVIISSKGTPRDTVADDTTPAKQRKYDIELCIVGSHKAAMKALDRLPANLQRKATLEYVQHSKQVRVVLTLATSRSHAIRTQEMLLEDFPDSYLFLHQDPRKAVGKP